MDFKIGQLQYVYRPQSVVYKIDSLVYNGNSIEFSYITQYKTFILNLRLLRESDTLLCLATKYASSTAISVDISIALITSLNLMAFTIDLTTILYS